MTDDRVFCDNCQQWLQHAQTYCPKFPSVSPPVDRKKWEECVCLVHTCHRAPIRGRDTAPTYRDF